MIDTIETLHKEKFEQWLLFGQHVLFTDIRISNSIIPKNIYKYELQEDDCHPFETIIIGKHITVNFEGTILSYQPIPLDKYHYRLIDEVKDIEYLSSKAITLNQYTHKMAKNIFPTKAR
ncbi:LPD28 domain-containing protein [Faecalitalea cylindroides]|uniref:Large polyvalent protein associated domain-containing protein n=1 Tax=Faecalitalea cylindroides ATCC 27803 TaxID=649755 RepID=U2R9Z0_9FIRM|nr:LPD28 domain-containing protein [Faecalitalea cylindroides]ERK47507.1 hypothetical protein HMPREF0367_00111 [[Eubacterium] cylindroides ATCC 27803] [Faecalitalea cylindroides ATCC 27803]